MRVAMLVRCLAMMRGGGETRHLAWARELRGMGVDVELISGRPLVVPPRYSMNGNAGATVRTPYLRDVVYRLQGRRGFGRFSSWLLHQDDDRFVAAAWRHLSTAPQRPDVVHAHALHQAAALRRFDVPVVINLPGVPHDRYRAALRSADALVSDGWGASHLPSLLGARVDDVPKGVDTVKFNPEGLNVRGELGLGADPVVLGVARLVPIKNVALLVDAFARVLGRIPTARLVLVGDGPEQERIRRRAASLGCAKRIVFAGAVDHDRLPSWYRAADVFALTSRFDNSPNVVLEAMASGVPIVATDVGGVSHYLMNGRHGALVPPENADALAAALESLLRDREHARALGRQARTDAVSSFSWRRSAEQLLAVYERVLSRPHEVRAAR